MFRFLQKQFIYLLFRNYLRAMTQGCPKYKTTKLTKLFCIVNYNMIVYVGTIAADIIFSRLSVNSTSLLPPLTVKSMNTEKLGTLRHQLYINTK